MTDSSSEEQQPERSGGPGRREPEMRLRTGAEQPWEPEDVAVGKGQDPTPRNVERSRRELEQDGPAVIERIVP